MNKAVIPDSFPQRVYLNTWLDRAGLLAIEMEATFLLELPICREESWQVTWKQASSFQCANQVEGTWPV